MADERARLDYAGGEVGPGRWGERRAGWWSVLLLVIGLAVGGLGAAGKVFGTDPHGRTSTRVRCAANMKQIGCAMLMYANENHYHYPDRLEELVMTQDIGAEAFVCPGTNDWPARGATTRALADGLTAGGHLSYVYLGAGLRNDCDPGTVILYESPANHEGDGMNVLFGDGRVQFVFGTAAREILDRVAAGERRIVWTGAGVKPATRSVAK